MLLVAALARNARAGIELKRHLSDRAHLEICIDPSRLLALVRHAQVSVVLLEFDALPGDEAAAFIEAVRRRDSSVPVIALVRSPENKLTALLHAAKAGLTDVAVLERDDIGAAIDRAWGRRPGVAPATRHTWSDAVVRLRAAAEEALQAPRPPVP